jgi:hypothetical protein
MMDVVTINIQGEDLNDRPARLLGALIDMGKLPRFVDAIVEKRDTWTTLWPDNLCCTCAHCNLSKGDKTEAEYLARMI